MKCLVVTRTITNGGDHLIAKKLLEVLENELPNLEIVFNDGSKELTTDYVNSFDKLIIGGGPIFENRIFNYEAFPILKIISNIEIPVSIIGSGWFGKSGHSDDIFSYKFNNDAVTVFNKVIETGGVLAGRDYLTTRVLKNNGFKNAIMTGCPVWYDYDFVNSTEINKNVDKSIKKIIISDPGITKEVEQQKIKAEQAIEVIKTVRGEFPNANIEFTFNNGIITKYSTECNVKIKEYLEEKNIKYHDLSNDWKGFQVYDDIDLHIGYRVHSHIYTLSKRIPSILIEEDARGYGVNHALGLETNMTSYDIKANLANKLEGNKNLLVHLNSSIDEMITNDFIRIKNAFVLMNKGYKTMQNVLSNI